MKVVPLVLVLIGTSLPVLAADAAVAALQDVNSANSALAHKQNDRALALAKKSLAVLETNPAKPAELSQADWEKRKALAIGTAHWIAGVAEASKNSFFAADKDLRASLPVVKSDAAMESTALFDLGLVNYQIGRQTYSKQKILEAAKFSEDCSKIPGQNQVTAYNNAKTMRKEAATMP